jgi:HPt (histidine-containing phosphotransfer) domain-containing protein
VTNGGISDDEIVAVRLTLAALAGGRPDVVMELAGLLGESMRRSIVRLQAAIGVDGQDVTMHAHTLRGAAAMAGLTTIAGLADRIEHADVEAEALPQAAADLGALVEQAIAAVSAA